jgi:phosphoglycolate phosphatase-like HAD superfamily hydrolase
MKPDSVTQDVKAPRYQRVRASGGSLSVGEYSRNLLAKVDAVAFDCDGVLIDARWSYDATIKAVVEMMVRELTSVRLSLSRDAPKLIAILRRTGGFNSDWDSTYALTLLSVVAIEARRYRDPLRGLRSVVGDFGSTRRETGISALDSFVNAEFPGLRERLDESREFLGTPNSVNESRMAACFDELYFGDALYEKVHGVPPKTQRGRGLIELERVLVRRKALESIVKSVGPARTVMVTGRPFVGVAYSLGKELMSYFKRDASMFIGDADISPELRQEYDRYRKPSPEALIRAYKKLGSSGLLYVGDSGEDIMMAQHARARGIHCMFAGVYGTAPDIREQVSFLEREGADVLARNVNQVPSALLPPSRKGGGSA